MRKVEPGVSASDIDAEKTKLRADAHANRDALSSGLGAAAAAGVAARFMSEPALAGRTGIGTVISGYMAIGSELDPATLMQLLAARGSRLCLPVVAAPGTPLLFRRWAAGDQLEAGVFTVPVPAEDAEELVPDILLVPLLAFDRQGRRLGYGGGYYDRTITALRAGKEILAVGLAFSGQLRDDMLVGPHDAPLDWIITESAALRVTTGRD